MRRDLYDMMVSERLPHFNSDISSHREYCNSTTDGYDNVVAFLEQTRRMGGNFPLKTSQQVLHQHAARRYSLQNDGSQYTNMNNTSTQSRFQCIQKTPLRNILSAPISQSARQFPPALSVHQDSLQSLSLESVDSPQTLEAARYKTELCRPFEETGQCRYGGKCQFAHGYPELRRLHRHPKYKTEQCRTFHTTGFCSYGQRCNFIHNAEERRGPAAAQQSPANSRQQTPDRLAMALPISTPLTIASTGESPASSISSGSPTTQSPHYLNDDVFTSVIGRSPSPCYGSDGGSLPSTSSPPSSPKHESFANENLLNSPHNFGLSYSLFSKLSLQ